MKQIIWFILGMKYLPLLFDSVFLYFKKICYLLFLCDSVFYCWKICYLIFF